MDVTTHYYKNAHTKKIEIELDVREAELLLYSLRRDPQKSQFAKRMIEQLIIYIKIAKEHQF